MLGITLAASPDAAYATSVTSINNFVNWVVSTSPPPDNGGYSGYSSAIAAFSALRNGAMPWFNNMYPACIEIAQQVVQTDSTITPELNLLIQLASQLQSQGSNPALTSQIAQATAALAGSTQKLMTAIQAVQQSLSTSANTFQTQGSQLAGPMNQLQSDSGQLYQQLGQLQAQLHSQQNATCPNQGDINATERLLQTTYQAFETAQALLALFETARKNAAPALQGLVYMAGYWHGCLNTGNNVVQALNQVATAPAALLKLDLQQAQSGWNSTVAAANQAIIKTANLAGAAARSASRAVV